MKQGKDVFVKSSSEVNWHMQTINGSMFTSYLLLQRSSRVHDNGLKNIVNIIIGLNELGVQNHIIHNKVNNR